MKNNNFLKLIRNRFTMFMLAALAIEIMSNSCSENNGNEGDISFYLTESSINIPAEASTKTFSVVSNIQWTASSNASWLTISPSSGSGNTTITVNATANSGTNTRTAIVTVSANSISHTVNVTQTTAIPVGSGLCVDGSSSATPQNGSASNPYRTIQAAINAASNGDIIKVAKGTYSEAVQIKNKKVQLLGGFAGSGNFTTANPQTNVTVISGTSATSCIKVDIQGASISGTLLINGFTIRNGQRGIELANGWSASMDRITIENNIIENNGVTGSTLQGGGISFGGSNVTIKNNTIRNNKAAKGAAIGRTDKITSFLIEGNRIENNLGYSDHGGGIDVHGTGTITKNVFDGNRIGEGITWGWGGAILISNENNPSYVITLSYNIYRNNYAPSRGGAVFVDDEANVKMEHELFYNNQSKESGSAIYVDGIGSKQSVLEMNNCTVSGNSTTNNTAALFVEGSRASVQNCIFWNNNGKDFETTGAAANLTVTYTLTQQGYTGTGNLTSNPLFVSATSGNFHLQSKGGHYNPSNGQWVNDGVHSPAIDKGNPASLYSNEPMPNGSRVNLGCYGNTAEASKSN